MAKKRKAEKLVKKLMKGGDPLLNVVGLDSPEGPVAPVEDEFQDFKSNSPIKDRFLELSGVNESDFENYREAVITHETGDSDDPYGTVQKVTRKGKTVADGPGKGAYQFEAPSLKTAAKKAYDITGDEIYKEIADGEITDATQLSPDLQDELFFASNLKRRYNRKTGEFTYYTPKKFSEIDYTDPDQVSELWHKEHNKGGKPAALKNMKRDTTRLFNQLELKLGGKVSDAKKKKRKKKKRGKYKKMMPGGPVGDELAKFGLRVREELDKLKKSRDDGNVAFTGMSDDDLLKLATEQVKASAKGQIANDRGNAGNSFDDSEFDQREADLNDVFDVLEGRQITDLDDVLDSDAEALRNSQRLVNSLNSFTNIGGAVGAAVSQDISNSGEGALSRGLQGIQAGASAFGIPGAIGGGVLGAFIGAAEGRIAQQTERLSDFTDLRSDIFSTTFNNGLGRAEEGGDVSEKLDVLLEDGVFVPIQAEKYDGQKETMTTGDGFVFETHAEEAHEDMDEKEPTDVVDPETFVYTSREELTQKDIELIYSHGIDHYSEDGKSYAISMERMEDLGLKVGMKISRAAEVIAEAYDVKTDNVRKKMGDFLRDKTDAANLDSRIKPLEILAAINESKKGVIEIEDVGLEAVATYKGGGKVMGIKRSLFEKMGGVKMLMPGGGVGNPDDELAQLKAESERLTTERSSTTDQARLNEINKRLAEIQKRRVVLIRGGAGATPSTPPVTTPPVTTTPTSPSAATSEEVYYTDELHKGYANARKLFSRADVLRKQEQIVAAGRAIKDSPFTSDVPDGLYGPVTHSNCIALESLNKDLPQTELDPIERTPVSPLPTVNKPVTPSVVPEAEASLGTLDPVKQPERLDLLGDIPELRQDILDDFDRNIAANDDFFRRESGNLAASLVTGVLGNAIQDPNEDAPILKPVIRRENSPQQTQAAIDAALTNNAAEIGAIGSGRRTTELAAVANKLVGSAADASAVAGTILQNDRQIRDANVASVVQTDNQNIAAETAAVNQERTNRNILRDDATNRLTSFFAAKREQRKNQFELNNEANVAKETRLIDLESKKRQLVLMGYKLDQVLKFNEETIDQILQASGVKLGEIQDRVA
jgi:hypothetical protein